MKKLVLVFGIIAGALSVGMGAMSEEEWGRTYDNCKNGDKSACQALIDGGLKSVQECNKDACFLIGFTYFIAGHPREAMPYFEKGIALGDNRAYGALGFTYGQLKDYFNAKKYLEIACNKVSEPIPCFKLGAMYYNGQGVRQDYHKAAELYKKACDMKDAGSCNDLGALYGRGQGVRQNLSIAEQYFGKACDLGHQPGCDNYRRLNQMGY